MLLAILITSPSLDTTNHIFATKYNKWQNEYRSYLFKTLEFNNITAIKRNGTIAKLPNDLMIGILKKMQDKAGCNFLNQYFNPEETDWKLFYFRAVQYWFKVLDREPLYNEDGKHCVTSEMKPIYASSNEQKNVI